MVPPTVTPVIDNGAVPLLLTVTVCAALVLPTAWEPNDTLAGDRVTAGAVPVPVKPRLCGLPAALSAIATVADRAPVATGSKVTDTEHEAFTASVAGANGQLSPSEKSPEFGPPTVTALIANGAVPTFFTVALSPPLIVPTAWLPNVRLVGDTDIAGAGSIAVPLRARLSGLSAALSAIETAALRLPDAVGEKLTEMLQLELAGSVDGLIGQFVL